MVFPYLQECENEMKTQTKTMEDGTVKEYYVPKEQEEDKLFDSGITQGINFAKYDKISVSLTKLPISSLFRRYQFILFKGTSQTCHLDKNWVGFY